MSVHHGLLLVGLADPTGHEQTPWATIFWALSEGLVVVVRIAAGAWVIGAVGGFLLALVGRFAFGPVRRLQELVVAVLRGIPELLVIYLVFYGLTSSFGWKVGPIQSVIVGLGTVYMGFASEYYRASFYTIPNGQRDAGSSLGMSRSQLLVYVYLPHIVRFMIPAWTNMFVGLLKVGTLASAVGVAEIVYRGTEYMKEGNSVAGVALMTAAVYLLLSIPLEIGRAHV